MVPLSINGQQRVAIDTRVSTTEVVQALAEELTVLRATRVKGSGESITFAAGPFRFVSSLNLLVPITRGRVSVERSEDQVTVKYELECTELVTVTTVLIALLFGPPTLAAPNLTSGEAFSVLAGSWLWLVGGNFVITMVRFPAFIKTTISRRFATEPKTNAA